MAMALADAQQRGVFHRMATTYHAQWWLAAGPYAVSASGATIAATRGGYLVGGRRPQFCVANAMAKTMLDGIWGRKRFAKARFALVSCGLIAMLQKPSLENGAAIYRFGQKPF